MKYSIIIPCYNEMDNIEDMINKIKPLQSYYSIQYIIVENGSTDNSRIYFQKNIDGKHHQVDIVYVKNNQGYGYGLQQGLKVATGDYVGWIHADMQMPPSELVKFFDAIEKHYDKPVFCKGIRTNRSLFDKVFTIGQSVFNSFLFGVKLYDIGAIPVVFHRSLLNKVNIDAMPNDFSIELYIYKEAIINGYDIVRYKVKLLNRTKGKSSWNNGLFSKLKQSKVIFIDSLKIKRGEKVL